MNTQNQTYPNALSNEEGQLIMPHLPEASPVGRPRKYGWRVVLDGIFYVLRTGCQWRYVPHDIAPWQVVYRGFRALGGLAFWQKVNELNGCQLKCA